MTNIITVLYAIIKPYKRAILIITLAILFIIASKYAYSRYYTPIVKTRNEDIANYNSNERIIVVYIFTVTWCPQCISSAPEWKSFKNKYHDTIVNGYKIKCMEIDCTVTSDTTNEISADIKDMMDKYEIEHYPTVKMLKNNVKIEFDGKVTEDNLDTFLNTMSAQE
jgi:thiol-disulfide isomerase/thioredoxin